MSQGRHQRATATHAIREDLQRLIESVMALSGRYGINQRPRASEATCEKKSLKHYPMDYLRIDISEIRTGEGKADLFVAVERASRFIHARLCQKMTKQGPLTFLRTRSKHCLIAPIKC